MMNIENRKEEGEGKKIREASCFISSLSMKSGNDQQMREKERV